MEIRGNDGRQTFRTPPLSGEEAEAVDYNRLVEMPPG